MRTWRIVPGAEAPGTVSRELCVGPQPRESGRGHQRGRQRHQHHHREQRRRQKPRFQTGVQDDDLDQAARVEQGAQSARLALGDADGPRRDERAAPLSRRRDRQNEREIQPRRAAAQKPKLHAQAAQREEQWQQKYLAQRRGLLFNRAAPRAARHDSPSHERAEQSVDSQRFSRPRRSQQDAQSQREPFK